MTAIVDAAGDGREASWWQRAVIYHVYPRSFMDSNGDGVGDLAGITSRLEYLVELGVDAVWLSPFYRSPMADFGYDVSDHCAVDPLFGDLADADALIARAHELGLRVVVDYVPNHTSDQHPWFIEARSSRRSPTRDWYVWSDPAIDGGVPNNWRSEFGGSAWTLDEATGQYYYHAYLAAQPNLNWHHPGVRRAMFDVLRFWLERGVDGFRLDAFRRLFVDLSFPDEPENPEYRPDVHNESFAVLPVHTSEQPELFELASEMRREIDASGDHLLLGEIYLGVEPLMRYHGTPDEPGLHLAGNFTLLWTPWDAGALADLLVTYESVLPDHAWPNWVLGNHDRSRVASRIGARQARVAAMFLLTTRGTPTIYYGDELGMTDVEIAPEAVQDPWEKNVPGMGFGRDPVRTPMAWTDGVHGGFSTVEPWLPLGPDTSERNVATQRADATSIWKLHQRLLALRRATPALVDGEITGVIAHEGVLAYRRQHAGSELLVLLEMSGRAASVSLQSHTARRCEYGFVVVLSTELDREGPIGSADATLELRADEGLVLEMVPRS
jgi:alpha-glucosidase